MPIRKVWIEEGCISCSLCEDTAREVFRVRAGETSKVRKGYGKVIVDADVAERVLEAEEACPVEVIHVEEEGSTQG